MVTVIRHNGGKTYRSEYSGSTDLYCHHRHAALLWSSISKARSDRSLDQKRRPSSKQVLVEVDAKFKHNFPCLSIRTGLERNHLYQIHAYVDAFSDPGHSAPGVLVYPDENDAGLPQGTFIWN
jgi:hypothetical protein